MSGETDKRSSGQLRVICDELVGHPSSVGCLELYYFCNSADKKILHEPSLAMSAYTPQRKEQVSHSTDLTSNRLVIEPELPHIRSHVYNLFN